VYLYWCFLSPRHCHAWFSTYLHHLLHRRNLSYCRCSVALSASLPSFIYAWLDISMSEWWCICSFVLSSHILFAIVITYKSALRVRGWPSVTPVTLSRCRLTSRIIHVSCEPHGEAVGRCAVVVTYDLDIFQPTLMWWLRCLEPMHFVSSDEGPFSRPVLMISVSNRGSDVLAPVYFCAIRV
jgi:hypothetical protein